MITIGIRATPKVVTFAVYDSARAAILNVEQIKIPAAFDTPDALKYVRSNLLDVLREYEVERAGIRVTESNAQSPSIERIQIEGVIQEAFASSPLQSYYVGQIASISKKLGFDRTRFNAIKDGDNDLEIQGWAKLAEHAREAVLTAMGAANA